MSVGVLDPSAPFPDPAAQLGVGAVDDVFGDVYGATSLPGPVTTTGVTSAESNPTADPQGTTG